MSHFLFLFVFLGESYWEPVIGQHTFVPGLRQNMSAGRSSGSTRGFKVQREATDSKKRSLFTVTQTFPHQSGFYQFIKNTVTSLFQRNPLLKVSDVTGLLVSCSHEPNTELHVAPDGEKM